MARILFILFLILPFIISASIEEIELDSKEVDEMSARFRSLRNYASHQDSTKEIQEDATKEAGSNEDNTDDPEVEAEPTAPYLLRDSSVEQEEECVALPNRTRVRPSFFQCKEDTKLELHGGAITNGNGDDAYPVSFNSSIRIFLDVTSHSNKRYDNLGVEVSIFKRSTGWFGCGWMFLPSFGLLSNYDMCEDNPSCPITPGRQVIEFEIDPTKLFTNFFRMIHYDLVGTDHKVTVVKKSIGES
uniref:MD-2-related lipid-recognition domain-containing protein n=1 Tax=Caenorhabditis japonica TaxID=281687 RepID=A0A8R1HGV3_CAEJA